MTWYIFFSQVILEPFRPHGHADADRQEETRATLRRSRLYLLARTAVMALTCLLWYTGPTAAQGPSEQAPLILHMLDYVAVDYPEFVQDGIALDAAEYAEQVEFSQQVQSMLAQLPAHLDQPGLLQQAAQLVALIQAKRPGPEVAALATQLRWSVIRAYNVEVAPKHLPDLRTAAPLYQTQCSGCHGPQGQGDGPAAASLDPSPSNFHERQRMDQRSLYSLYSTITLGVQGTGMSSFRLLGDEERWALAFYVGNLAHHEADLKRGAELWQSGVGHTWFPDLASVATATVSDVRAEHGDDAVHVLVYLRSHPERVMPASETPLARSSRLLRASLEAYRQGQAQAARELAVSAYLDGFELVEASLDTVDKPFRMMVEAAMLRYRAMLKNGEPIAAAERQADRILELLTEAQRRLESTRLPAGATFFSAFVILLREGMEAILVLAAIFALLIKAGRRDAMPYVHAGWIAALAVALVVLGWLILRGSIRLPLGLFFGATSVLLALLAVIFVGKGVAALQEAGTLPVDSVNVPAIPTLGLYPNLQGLALQVLLILLIGGVFAYTHYTASEVR